MDGWALDSKSWQEIRKLSMMKIGVVMKVQTLICLMTYQDRYMLAPGSTLCHQVVVLRLKRFIIGVCKLFDCAVSHGRGFFSNYPKFRGAAGGFKLDSLFKTDRYTSLKQHDDSNTLYMQGSKTVFTSGSQFILLKMRVENGMEDMCRASGTGPARTHMTIKANKQLLTHDSDTTVTAQPTRFHAQHESGKYTLHPRESFGGGPTVKDGGLTGFPEKINPDSPHNVQSSRFAQWFNEDEKKLVDDFSSSRPNNLLSLIGGGEKADPIAPELSYKGFGIVKTPSDPKSLIIVDEVANTHNSNKGKMQPGDVAFDISDKLVVLNSGFRGRGPFDTLEPKTEFNNSQNQRPLFLPSDANQHHMRFPDHLMQHNSPISHKFPANMHVPRFHHPNGRITGFDVDANIQLQMLPQMKMQGNFQPPQLLQRPQASNFLPDHGIPFTHHQQTNIGGPGLPVSVPFADGSNHPEAFQRMMEMELQAQSMGNSQGTYGHGFQMQIGTKI